ncbi:SDR family NAD(P)-dependent oxidoreductase [Novosphingobium sp.]|uniref:SDR family NAD(P)-dependent oxidoreductase n=1 Tax=Novosphingobium sp. TaxID=1874826 RepID=UPI0025D4E4C0|nr:SDR family NAD(P)-dependent oxidoreductase [Novosphingobium sp.]
MPEVAVVFGASGGIGAALVANLAASGRYSQIHAGARRNLEELPPGVSAFRFELGDERSIAAAVAALSSPPTLVAIATGVLHDDGLALQPEKSARAIDPAAMEQVLAINTVGPALIAKHVLPHLPRERRAVFAALSAKVGSISDNRLGGWHSYRASKAALNMLIKTFAIELSRTHPLAVVAALHPGTVASALSAPFSRGMAPDALFAAERAAAQLMDVIEGLEPRDSGGLFSWDGSRLPY